MIGGSRIPLIMFGGKVGQGIDSQWHSHASIPKTIIDSARPAADRCAAGRHRRLTGRPRRPDVGSADPAGQARRSPSRPLRTRPRCRSIPAPWPGPTGQPLPDLVTLDGSSIPAPADAVVHAKPPKPPALPAPHSAPPPGAAPSPALGDLVDKPYAGTTATELAAAPLTALKGISPTKAAALTQALGARTIGELATNRYVQAAQTINQATHVKRPTLSLHFAHRLRPVAPRGATQRTDHRRARFKL